MYVGNDVMPKIIWRTLEHTILDPFCSQKSWNLFFLRKKSFDLLCLSPIAVQIRHLRIKCYQQCQPNLCHSFYNQDNIWTKHVQVFPSLVSCMLFFVGKESPQLHWRLWVRCRARRASPSLMIEFINGEEAWNPHRRRGHWEPPTTIKVSFYTFINPDLYSSLHAS